MSSAFSPYHHELDSTRMIHTRAWLEQAYAAISSYNEDVWQISVKQYFFLYDKQRINDYQGKAQAKINILISPHLPPYSKKDEVTQLLEKTLKIIQEEKLSPCSALFQSAILLNA